ncbi:MAG: bifunctional hydroxymethylpyrimidine kinase/phosphomethylpyrimidine kinase [Chloroflexi bacterium]|nr:bifunctional hydroxymethylpyrimidine kinase/phosphomethylpyrimidine kinase [Chloroflexota bacterium]
MTIARVLIIAGSDSGGGAGIQADLKAVSARGAFGMTAITALTAQSTTGVTGVVEIDPAFVAQQIDDVVVDIGVDATKTGMLASAAIIAAVADRVRAHRLDPLVVDPVMIAKSGAPLLHADAVGALKAELLPLATIVTPNRHEAEALSGLTIHTLDDARATARAIHALGPRYVVVKGGHVGDGPEAVDVLFDGASFRAFHAERLDARHTHGTGCMFASAIAAELAKGAAIDDALAVAKGFITLAIRHGLALGRGVGPANPLAELYAQAGWPPGGFESG